MIMLTSDDEIYMYKVTMWIKCVIVYE